MEAKDSSRRELLGRAAAAGLVAASPALVDSRALARSIPKPPRGDRRPRLPGKGRIHRQVREMVDLGPRLPGTKGHDKFTDLIEHRFAKAGLRVERDPHHFQRWSAKGRGLHLLDGPAQGKVDVATYYTYSGRTGPEGVEGPLAYAGALPPLSLTGEVLDGPTIAATLEAFVDELPAAVSALLAGVAGGVAGKIVVMDAPVAPLPMRALSALSAYTHDPNNTFGLTGDYKRAWTTILTLPPLNVFSALGAVGVVFVMDGSAENIRGQYTPFLKTFQGLPSLICAREEGERLRSAAGAGARARLRLEATLTDDVRSDSLIATLPGRSGASESVIVHTHTDGQNAFEENGPIAQIALARYFSRIPREARKREIVFSAATGHFGPGLPEVEGFIEDHPDVIERAHSALVFEHFGAREWLDDARGYYESGVPDLGAIFHTPGPMTELGIETIKAVNLRRTMLLRPLHPLPVSPAFFGVGSALHTEGIPTLAYISGPNYLLALDGTDGHIDKFSPHRFRTELRWANEVLKRLVL